MSKGWANKSWQFLLMRLFESTGLALSIYLASTHYYNRVPICFGKKGCDSLLTGSLSTIYGIPVSAIGAFGFSILSLFSCASILVNLPVKIDFSRLHHGMALLGLLFSSWLTVAGFLTNHAFCPWCLTVLLCIIMIERMSFLQLHSERRLNLTLGAISILLLSIASVLGMVVVVKQRTAAMMTQISAQSFSKVSESDLVGEPDSNFNSKITHFVGFYIPGCGGCRQSLLAIKEKAEVRKELVFDSRFVCDEVSPEFEFTAYLQAVRNSREGLKIVAEYLAQQQVVLTTDGLVSYLNSHRHSLPTDIEVRNGRHMVRANFRVATRLGIRGFPVVVRVEDHLKREVNPITLDEFSED